jgi:regulator of sigma E protease
MPVSWFQAVPFAVKLTADQSYQILMLPIQLIRGAIPAEQARLVSPVGVYSIYSQVREQEAAAEAVTPGLAVLNILNFFGMISVVLGISNLLPIPALDGGRILFVLPELILRKRVPARYENMIHFVGFTLLIGLMVFLMFQDIVNPVVLP